MVTELYNKLTRMDFRGSTTNVSIVGVIECLGKGANYDIICAAIKYSSENSERSL